MKTQANVTGRKYAADGNQVEIPRIAYSPAEAAIASGRSRSRIYLAIKAGELKAVKDGGCTLVLHAELCRWLNELPPIVPTHRGAAADA